MNWKNRTYFQGSDARPMAQSADVSRVGSGKGKGGFGRWIRRTFWRLFLLALVFGAGLAVGLVEDYEAEGFLEKVKEDLGLRDTPSREPEWLRRWNSARHDRTNHFKCRMECRNVEMNEVESAVKNGRLIDYVPSECLENGGYSGDKYTIEGYSHTGRLLAVVFAASQFAFAVKLITVWEVGKDYECPQDC